MSSFARPIKKIFLILISFIPAVFLLSITNVIFAHLFVLAAIVFPPEPQPAIPIVEPKKPPAKKAKKKVPPKIVRKTVYVAPTSEDLERIERELETSHPLLPIPIDDDTQRSIASVQTVLFSTETLLIQRDEEFETVEKEIDDLSEAFESFLERLERDTSRDLLLSEANTKHFQLQLDFLKSVLGRTSFKDLDRADVVQILTVAIRDLRWLLTVEKAPGNAQKNAFFYNVNNTLLAAFTDETTSKASTACHPSFLALDEGEPSKEFTPPPKPVKKKPKAKALTPAAPTITNETARESDLYALVENVKDMLSRRDLSSIKLEDHESLPHPIDEEAVEEIRSQIAPMVNAVRKKRETALVLERNTREYWIGRTEALRRGSAPSGDDGGASLCATPELVEGMIAGGLETLRRKDVLRSFLVNTAFASVSDHPSKVLALSDEMKKVVVEEVFPENDNGGDGFVPPPPPPRGRSSWKTGRRSVAYAVDGPLLHRGVVGWIDSFVDAISGYNDHIDAMFDQVVGDEGVSVGTSAAEAFSKVVRKIPFPDARHFKKAGILAGRTRIILEE